MITRFRIESEHNSQQDVIDEMTKQAVDFMKLIDQDEGEWECTQDVTLKISTGYKGRMVFKFIPEFHEEVE